MKNRYAKQITAMGLFAVALWTAACGGGTNTPTATKVRRQRQAAVVAACADQAT